MSARSGLVRIAIVAAVAAMMLAITSAAAPASGSKWSDTKCRNHFVTWSQKHPSASAKKVNGYLHQLEKAHDCTVAG